MSIKKLNVTGESIDDTVSQVENKAFTDVMKGVTPTDDADAASLATKEYADAHGGVATVISEEEPDASEYDIWLKPGAGGMSDDKLIELSTIGTVLINGDKHPRTYIYAASDGDVNIGDTDYPTALRINGIPFVSSGDTTFNTSVIPDLSGNYSTTGHTHSGYVPTTRTVNSKALSSNISLTASDVGAATSGHTHSGYASSTHTHTISNSDLPNNPTFTTIKLTQLKTTGTYMAGFTSDYELRRFVASSRRYKHDIEDCPLEDAEKLYLLPIRQFKYNNDYIDEKDDWFDKEVPGFIAEELEELLPIAVGHDRDGQVENWNHAAIIPLMLKLIQEQHKEIEQLKERIDQLRNQ